MSELEPASTSAPTNSTSTETTQNASEIPLKSENQQHLYMDFASDVPPVLPTDSQLGGDGIKPDSQVVRKVDPRQQWINKDSTKPYYCKLCDFNMESMEVFQHHCMSPRHVKRAIEEFNIKLPKRLEEKEEKKPPPEFHCQVCLVTCNSDTAWNSHLLGQKHRKLLEKQGAERALQKAQEKSMLFNNMNTGFGRGAGRGAPGRGGGVGPIKGGSYNPGHMRKPYEKPMHAVQQPSPSGPIGARDFATYPEPLIGLEYVTEIQVIGQSPRYHCELCDSKFDHNLKFPHLVGSKHRFNVLKEKVPDVAQSVRGDVKKRSELSSKLLEEASKLEMMEGRQQVKTRTEKSPFNRINNQAAGDVGGFSGNFKGQQSSRGGGQQWQNQRARGQGGGRGSRMGTRGRGQMYGGGQNNTRGGMQGGRGRGNQHGTPYNYNQQQSGSYRGRGRARGRGGNNQNQSWNQNFSSYNNAPNQTFVDSSYGGDNDGYQWDNSAQGGGERMLPPEAFGSRSQPQSQGQQFINYDEHYDDYYGNQNTSYGGSNYEYIEPYADQSTYSTQSANQQRFQPPAHTPSANVGSSVGSDSGGVSGKSNVSLLQGAIADLGKLVSSEEDASMALQVSNALTQALLQFRMNNLSKEGDTNTAASTATHMDAGPQI